MPDLTIDGFVDDVARRSNIDPAAAETAVGTILSVIQQEAKFFKRDASLRPLTGCRGTRAETCGIGGIWDWYGRSLEQFSG